ncbi:MAG TPA: glycosyltransferase [Pyrinomonadaceae bacterium]|nr:glycosyltransferase [Pyrinomonadaceae bacterium]
MTKIAIVHDYFIQMGGAERVAEELHSIFPEASMVTTVDMRREIPRAIKNSPVKTSWMQHLPINQKNHRLYFLLYPFAVNSLDLSDFDLIISSSSGYAKGVKKKKGAVHICYCHTPMRWVWRYEDYVAREQMGKVSKKVLPFLLSGLKKWDLRAAQQPDFYIANSEVVAQRIREFYKREAIVIPPPIDVERFSIDETDGDFYLLLSRLSSYKRLDLAVEACKKLDRPLVVIGDGPLRKQLEEQAGPNTRFLGRQPDEIVAKYASQCRALIFPGEEDFGMTPLEINAAGRPVIAFNGGGARETVIAGKTGVFFKEQTPESLMEAIEEFESLNWNRQALRQHAEKFNRNVFASRILDFVGNAAPVVSTNEFLELKASSTFTVQKGTA